MLETYFYVLIVLLGMGFVTWLLSLYLRNVGIVDSLWSLMFLAAALFVYLANPEATAKNLFLLVLVAVWSLRLSLFLTIRNWGEPEDRRYQQIRANNSPNFAVKSLFIIFVLQALIAWVVFAGLLPGMYVPMTWHWLDTLGIALFVTGLLTEAVADQQLHRFRQQRKAGEVLQSGLWRYSRHPNYFGEFLVWWGFFLLVITTGYWWAIVAPLVMTLLLLKVSGVGLMEQGITERRPAYRDYIQRTNAFFPGMPRKPVSQPMQESHS